MLPFFGVISIHLICSQKKKSQVNTIYLSEPQVCENFQIWDRSKNIPDNFHIGLNGDTSITLLIKSQNSVHSNYLNTAHLQFNNKKIINRNPSNFKVFILKFEFKVKNVINIENIKTYAVLEGIIQVEINLT